LRGAAIISMQFVCRLRPIFVPGWQVFGWPVRNNRFKQF
jgi:hypothetical protein